MKRLLLISHRAITQEAGPAARWRSLAQRLPALGWEVDVVSAPERAGNVEFAVDERRRRLAARRAAVMERVGRASDPLFALAGVRPDALPLSMAWIPRGARDVRRRLHHGNHDVVLATGPPMAGLLAAALGARTAPAPLVIELRDLWAGNPAFDRRGELLGALERWTLRSAAAVVACTPEAADDLRRRHARHAERVEEIPNGFEPELLTRRDGRTLPPPPQPLTILHSGTLTVDRPLTPLLRVLRRDPWRNAFRLVLHGYASPPILRQIREGAGGAQVELLPASSWEGAVDQIVACDVGLVSQARGAGDRTAVASKVYEYMALGRPVLCTSHGGATEALLRRLGAGDLCARLDDAGSIERALDHLRERRVPPPVPPERLAPYDRGRIAERMAGLLDSLSDRR